MSKPDNIPTILAFIKAWKSLDLEKLLGYFTEDAVYENVPIQVDTGIAAIRKSLEGFVGMAGECEWLVHDIAQSASGAVMTERLDRFNIGGRWIEMRCMGIFQLRDGKIALWRDYFDVGQYTAQMG